MMKQTMKLREGGNEHEIGNTQCPACVQRTPTGRPLEERGRTHFPYPHGSPCLGLVHAEVFPDERGATAEYRCDVCGG